MNELVKKLQAISNELYPNKFNWIGLPSATKEEVSKEQLIKEIEDMIVSYETENEFTQATEMKEVKDKFIKL